MIPAVTYVAANFTATLFFFFLIYLFINFWKRYSSYFCQQENASKPAMNTILSEAVKTNLLTFIRHYLSIKPRYTYKEVCGIINNHHKIPLTVRQMKYISKKKESYNILLSTIILYNSVYQMKIRHPEIELIELSVDK